MRGHREELMRVAINPTTGARVELVDEAALRRARSADSEDITDAWTTVPPSALWRVQELLEPAARAAARLARIQALPDYQRRQGNIETMYVRLLQEAPERGADVLAARTRELSRLAENYAIDLDIHVLNVTTILSPMAEVRVRYGADSVNVDVDLGRGSVAALACAACGSAWRVGARCAEGHITCLACQQRCDHCGRRQCARCATLPMSWCSTCGKQVCQKCAESAARGRHRPCARAARHVEWGEPAAAIPETGDEATLRGEDLRVGDLDAMSGATWRAYLKWLVQGMGYRVEGDCTACADTLDDGGDVVLVCQRRPSPGLQRQAPWANLLAAKAQMAPRTVVVGYRPRYPAALGDEVFARARRLAALVQRSNRRSKGENKGARALLVTTAFGSQAGEGGGLPLARSCARQSAADVELLDRAQLIRLLGRAAATVRRERAEVDEKTDALAASAASVRETLLRGCREAAQRLGDGMPVADAEVARDATGVVERAGEAAIREGEVPVTAKAQMVNAVHVTRVARQALAALETLAEQWEANFEPTPTRAGQLAIMSNTAAYDAQRERAEHLGEALKASCIDLNRLTVAIFGAPGIRTTWSSWWEAVLDELRHRGEALAARCEAIDPERWRSFDAAHDREAAQRSIDALAASRRAELRAAGLLCQIEGHVAGVSSPTARQEPFLRLDRMPS
jgi:hypothetical protein